MPEPVSLYVYDLSNGLARSMSMQLTGRQIDGIWQVSTVLPSSNASQRCNVVGTHLSLYMNKKSSMVKAYR
jgi:hypothetical protein